MEVRPNDETVSEAEQATEDGEVLPNTFPSFVLFAPFFYIRRNMESGTFIL